jgi:PAS domain S-box-containing protein
MITIVILVTGSVALISGLLYIYFGKRLESEFNKKVTAQRGQVEIILKNRLAEVENLLKILSSDNAIRFTMKMGKNSKLEDLIKHFYPGNKDVYFYIRKQSDQTVYPKVHAFPKDVMDILDLPRVNGKIIEDGDKTGLIWRFNAPIMQLEQPMGTAYALYNMAEDTRLINTIKQTVDGNLSIVKDKDLQSIIDGSVLPSIMEKLHDENSGSGLMYLDPDLVLSQLDGFNNLYFVTCKKTLIKEKNRIFILLSLFTAFVLIVSATLSVLLGRMMARPLNEMANKAIQISEGEKDLAFENSSNSYWEFNQLSMAFNYMLVNLKKMEEKSRFTELLENVDDAVYLFDQHGNILEANEATYLKLGYSQEIFFKLDLFAVLPEADAEKLLNQLNENNQVENSNKTTIETFHSKTDGNLIPVEISSRPITYRDKKVVLNVARDISERREAEIALRESEERYRSVVESSHDGILILDKQLLIIYANNELCKLLGYSFNKIEGKSFKKFLAEESLPFLTDRYLCKSSQGKAKLQYEIIIIREDGDERRCKISVTTIKDSAGQEKNIFQILDITEQFRAAQKEKQLEAQLLHSQKMKAVGTLAGGVAHDFNNLLQIIHGYTEILLLKKTEGDPDFSRLQEIKNASQRASELTRQLLTFSRKVESNLRPLDLNHEVKQIHKLLKRTIPQMIAIELRLADDLKTVNADAAQLGQIIINLGVNARDAMPDGGKLVIATKNAVLDEQFCKTHLGSKPGNYVCVIMSDSGHGMNKETLEHIFEPFFTTKETGKGTGLGLAIIYGIVKNHGGYITCDSELNKGTTFKVYLLAEDKKVIPHAKKKEQTQTGGDETILLVDDDEHIQSLGSEMLSESGYTMITASDGEQALDIYHKNGTEIDLIILDLMMPGMGGKKCLEKLLKINPEVKVLIASGHLGDNSAETNNNDVMSHAKGFIPKPYDIGAILRMVRNVLDERQPEN